MYTTLRRASQTTPADSAIPALRTPFDDFFTQRNQACSRCKTYKNTKALLIALIYGSQKSVIKYLGFHVGFSSFNIFQAWDSSADCDFPLFFCHFPCFRFFIETNSDRGGKTKISTKRPPPQKSDFCQNIVE